VPYPEESLVRAGLEKFGLASQGVNAGNLIYERRPNLNDPNKTPIVFGRDPATNDIILATRMNQQTKELQWYVAGLRDLADTLGIIVGMTLNQPFYPISNAERTALDEKIVTQDFNGAILERTTWVEIEEQEGQFNFQKADQAVRLAQEHNMFIRGDHIINPPSNFDWTYLKDIPIPELTRDRLINIMKNHIKGEMEHFKGKIQLYGVVNESRPPSEKKSDGRPYDMFNVIIGEDYIEIAFDTARETEPSAILIYNETKNHIKNQDLYPRTKAIVDRLKDRKVNGKNVLDGVGVQMHLRGDDPPAYDQIVEAFRSYGVPVFITELDVDMRKVQGLSDEQILKRQAEIYGTVSRAALDSGVCRQIYVWDINDQNSWLVRDGGDPKARPTLFDGFSPKPAYFAIRKVLLEKLAQK
jgi:endo-1,4-beta-xylanase